MGVGVIFNRKQRDGAGFMYDVPLGTREKGRNTERVSVEMFDSFCDYLLVHESIGVKGWSITHVQTGYVVAEGLKNKEAALMTSGALAFLVPWSDEHSHIIRQKVRELPEEFREWIEHDLQVPR